MCTRVAGVGRQTALISSWGGLGHGLSVVDPRCEELSMVGSQHSVIAGLSAQGLITRWNSPLDSKEPVECTHWETITLQNLENVLGLILQLPSPLSLIPRATRVELRVS